MNEQNNYDIVKAMQNIVYFFNLFVDILSQKVVFYTIDRKKIVFKVCMAGIYYFYQLINLFFFVCHFQLKVLFISFSLKHLQYFKVEFIDKNLSDFSLIFHQISSILMIIIKG